MYNFEASMPVEVLQSIREMQGTPEELETIRDIEINYTSR